MKKYFEFLFPEYSDKRGSLVPIEFDENFPLKKTERVYFLYNSPKDETRGAHCHFIEEEVFVCIKGHCTALIDEDGKGKKEVLLSSPTKAIYVGTKVWHEFCDFSEDAVLLCFSSTSYLPGETNYEFNYEKFLEIKKDIG